MNAEIIKQIEEKVDKCSLMLMEKEHKEFCLNKVSRNNWIIMENYVIVPSPLFKRFILNKGYMKVVESFPEKLGSSDDCEIIRAIKSSNDMYNNMREDEFYDFLRNENMAYVFEIKDGAVSDKILRLDLFRFINKDNEFKGGIFHILKHFTVEDFYTISSNKNSEYKVKTFESICYNIIDNFFTGDQVHKSNTEYTIHSYLDDKHIMQGFYFNEGDVPVYFLDTLYVKRLNKKENANFNR